MSKTSDGPDVDFDTSVELLASHIPHTLVRNGLNFYKEQAFYFLIILELEVACG